MEPTFFRPVVDDLSAYREAVAKAEADAVTVVVDEMGRTPEGAVPTEDLTAVPVVASDQVIQPEVTPGTEATAVVTETPVVEAPAVAEETPEQKVARLEAELAQREAQLAEKEKFIGQQSTQVGDVRAELQQLRDELAARTPQTPAPVPVAITQDMIDNDPATATILAYQQNDGFALERAFEAWKEEDPFSAASWRSDTLAQQREAAIRADVQRQIDERNAREAAAASANAAWGDAMNLVGSKYPDFLAVGADGRSNAERLLNDVAPQLAPELLATLRDGSAQAKADILESLHLRDRANSSDPNAVRAQLEEAAALAAAEEAAARAAAATVVGQPTAGQDPVPESYEEREKKAYEARRATAPSLSRGWTGRS